MTGGRVIVTVLSCVLVKTSYAQGMVCKINKTIFYSNNFFKKKLFYITNNRT